MAGIAAVVDLFPTGSVVALPDDCYHGVVGQSPSNPLLKVADLEAICAAPGKRGAILGVDDTFATPLNQRPWRSGRTWPCNQ